MTDVFIRGAATTRFGLHLDRSIKEMTAEAISGALKDADVDRDQIDAIFFGNLLSGPVEGLTANRGAIYCMPSGFGRIPIHTVENACATGADALHLATLSVLAGLHRTVLVVGCEKANHRDRKVSFAAYASTLDPDENIAESFELSEGAGTDRTVAVDRHALIGRQLMAETGLTVEDFAELAASVYSHARLNPNAHRQEGATAEEVLASRLVTAPITKLMMSPISDGAAAVVITGGPAGERDIRIAGSRIATRSAFDDEDGPTAGSSALEAVFEASGMGAGDFDVAELHDASVPYLIHSLRDAQLVAPGNEARWIQDGGARLGSRCPVNTSGGQLGRGHAIGATGLAQVVELTQQLRGEAGPRQVEGARTALAHLGGGIIRFKTSVAAAHVLVRDRGRS